MMPAWGRQGILECWSNGEKNKKKKYLKVFTNIPSFHDSNIPFPSTSDRRNSEVFVEDK